MKNLLTLDLGNNDAIALSTPYQNMNDRKEIYLKYLIIASLKAKANIVDIQDSLFYSRKFYSLTRLFDFYVNNNVFDLIILKPDNNEVLFDVIQDEIHANIYGYTVARISPDFKTAELLGYFLSKDFNKIVLGKNINIANLTPINDFENIEIMDSQMSLEDVSDRFFELMSNFLDDDIDEAGLSEFACLLYNSCELREAFSEMGRFENICYDLKDNKSLVEDEFLSVFNGEMAEKLTQKQEQSQDVQNVEPDEKDEFILDDLNSLVEDEPLSIDTDDIDLSTDLEQLSEVKPETIEFENILPTTDTATNTDTTQNNVSLDENTNLDILSDTQNDEIAFDLDELTIEQASEDLPIIEEQQQNDDNLLDEIANDTTENLLDDTENINEIELPTLEDTNDIETTNLDNSTLLDSLDMNLNLQLDSTDNTQLSNEPSLELEELIINENIMPEVEEKKTNPNENKLAAELASLALKTEENEDEYKTPIQTKENIIEIIEELPLLDDIEIKEELQPSEPIKTPLQEIKEQEIEKEVTNTSTENISNELLEILNDTSNDMDVILDDNEILSILGAQENPAQPQQIQQPDEIQLEFETEQPKEQNPLQNPLQIPQNRIEMNSETQEQNDLSLLYATNNQTQQDEKSEEDINNIQIGYKNIESKKQPKKAGLAIVAVLALIIVVGIITNMNSSKKAQVDSEIYNNEIAQNDNIRQINKVSKSDIVDEIKQDNDIVPTLTQQTKQNTKIETSLSNQAGAAPVILKSVAWQVPTSISKDAIFNKYLQIAGKNIKLNLTTDLLDTDDFAYNNKIKISMTVKNNTPVKNIKVVESSGSKNVDDIVLQSIKQTLKYINTPVMSEDNGDREVILVISI